MFILSLIGKIIGFLLSVAITAAAVYFAYKYKKCEDSKENDKEKFCGTCQGIGNKVCPNRKLLHQLYNDGKLTEYTTSQKPQEWKEMNWDKFLNQEK